MKSARKFLALAVSFVFLLSIAGCGTVGTPSDTATNAAPAAAPAAPAAPAENAAAPEAAPVAPAENEAAAPAEAASTGTYQAENVVFALDANFDPGPFGAVSGARDQFCQQLYASLVWFNSRSETVDQGEPWLAKSWEKTGDLTYEIVLFDNILDSKGNQITADDVIWSYEMSATQGEQINIGSNMKAMTKVDDYTLQVELVSPGVGMIEDLLGGNRITIVDKDWYENASAEERVNDPATTGAYTIVSHSPGAELVLTAREDYWKPDAEISTAEKRNVKNSTFRVIAESAVSSIALENGEIDATNIEPTDIGRYYVDGAPLPGWNAYVSPSNSVRSLFLNMDENSTSPIATNLPLRKAVLHAIDARSMSYADGNNDDTAALAVCFSNPGAAGALDTWTYEEYWPYDPELSKQYLAEAGYEPGELTLRILSRNDGNAEAIDAVMIASLQAVGINVEIIGMDSGAFNEFKFMSAEWDIKRDNAGGTHVAQGWNTAFNPAGYENGGVCFNHDDKLVALLKQAYEVADEASIEAFHNYLIEIACCKGNYLPNRFCVTKAGITKIAVNNGNFLFAGACEYSPDFVSAAQ